MTDPPHGHDRPHPQAPGAASGPGAGPYGGAGTPGPPPARGGPPGSPGPGHGHPPYGPPPGYGYAGHGAFGPRRSGGDDRTLAMFCHLGALLAGFFLGPLTFLAPMVIYLMKREESPFIRHHGAQALNVTLTELIVVSVGTIVGVVLGLLTLGIGLLFLFPLLIAYVIIVLVFQILAALASARGEWYRYPGWLYIPMVR